MVPRKVLTPYYIGQRVPLEVPGADVYEATSTLPMGIVYRPILWAFGCTRPVLSVAGDCVSCIAAMAGYAQRSLYPRLVWVDAHGDFNTEDSTPSAHLGGMPLAKLCGYGEQTLMRDYGCPVLRGEQVTHVCGRDFDSGERERMLEAGVVLGDLDTLPDEPVHLHIDLDVLAPDVLPCVNYPAPGGLSPDELTWFSCNLVRRGAVGITISAHDPRLDDGTGAAVLNHIVDAIASAMQENA